MGVEEAGDGISKIMDRRGNSSRVGRTRCRVPRNGNMNSDCKSSASIDKGYHRGLLLHLRFLDSFLDGWADPRVGGLEKEVRGVVVIYFK